VEIGQGRGGTGWWGEAGFIGLDWRDEWGQDLLIDMKWFSKAVGVFVGILLILCLISMSLMFLRLAICGEVGQTTCPTLGMRFYTGVLAAFFLFLCYPVWRILLFRKEKPFLSAPLSAMSRIEKPEDKEMGNAIPIASIDLAKRYDIYYSAISEDRLFENVRILGIKTLERMTKFSSGLLGGWIEVEASNGTKMMIRNHGIHMICEAGSIPVYKVIPRPIADSKEG